MKVNVKILYLIQGFTALICGALIYWLFSPDVYFLRIFDFSSVNIGYTLFAVVCRNYFCDYLWCYSLCCFLYLVFTPKTVLMILLSFISVLSGVLWEVFQHFDFVNGTADLIDIIMYLSAGVIAVLINKNFQKEKRKNEKG